MLYNEDKKPKAYEPMTRSEVAAIHEAGKRHSFLMNLSKMERNKTAAMRYSREAMDLKEQIYQKYQVIL